MSLSERLKELRKEIGLTQQELADKTGLSIHTINSYESGRREPNSKAMTTLENYFNVSGTYLRGETDNRDLTSNDEANCDPSLASILNKISAASEKCSEEEKSLLLDVLVELYNIVEIDDKNAEKRFEAISLLHETVTRLNKII